MKLSEDTTKRLLQWLMLACGLDAVAALYSVLSFPISLRFGLYFPYENGIPALLAAIAGILGCVLGCRFWNSGRRLLIVWAVLGLIGFSLGRIEVLRAVIAETQRTTYYDPLPKNLLRFAIDSLFRLGRQNTLQLLTLAVLFDRWIVRLFQPAMTEGHKFAVLPVDEHVVPAERSTGIS